MNKKELAQKAARILRINDYKKPVHIPKQVLRVSLGDRSTSLSIKPYDKEVIYTVEDVECILEALLTAIVDGMKNGEETFLYGFGTFAPKLRAARRVVRVDNGEWADIKEHYVPVFESGKDMRMAAAVYNARVNEGDNPFYVDDELGDIDLDSPEDDTEIATGDDVDA